MGPTPAPRPRRAQRWTHRAAPCGGPRQSPIRRIARRIRRRRERPGRRGVRRFRLRRSAECGGRVPAAVCRAGIRRCTRPRAMAHPTPSPSSSCAAPTGPSRTSSSGNAALRRTDELKPQQPRACRRTPKQWAETFGKLAQYEAAEEAEAEVRPLAVRVGLHGSASACTTIRRYWAKYSSYGGVRWSFSAQIRFQPMRHKHRGIVGEIPVSSVVGWVGV